MASQSWATMRSRNRSMTPSLTSMSGAYRRRSRPSKVPVPAGAHPGKFSAGAVAAAARVMVRAARTRLLLLVAPFVAAAAAVPVMLPFARAGAEPRSQTPPPANVMQIYLADCAICHGADARGTNQGPSLIGVGRASVDYYLTTGRMPIVNPALYPIDPNKVPRRHKPYYPPATINALEDYIEGITGPGGPGIPFLEPNPNVAVGGEVFRLQCAACHAWAGDGGALLHREAPQLHDATR